MVVQKQMPRSNIKVGDVVTAPTSNVELKRLAEQRKLEWQSKHALAKKPDVVSKVVPGKYGGVCPSCETSFVNLGIADEARQDGHVAACFSADMG